jgi:hypothetical protein
MRARVCFTAALYAAAALAGSLFDPQPARAQREPVIVVPGRPGYQVIMWGQDVSGAVLEGEFGLDRPGFGVTVIPAAPTAYVGITPGPGGFFPATGVKPRSGRLEVVPPPNRPKPPPAPTFFRSWSSESPHLPANDVPQNPPPVILAPQINSAPANSWPQPKPAPHQP